MSTVKNNLSFLQRLAAIYGKSPGDDAITFMARKYSDYSVEGFAKVMEDGYTGDGAKRAENRLKKTLADGRKAQDQANKEVISLLTQVDTKKITKDTALKQWKDSGFFETRTFSAIDYFMYKLAIGCLDVGNDIDRSAQVVTVVRNDKKIDQYLTRVQDADLNAIVLGMMRNPLAQQINDRTIGVDVLMASFLAALFKVDAILKGRNVTVNAK